MEDKYAQLGKKNRIRYLNGLKGLYGSEPITEIAIKASIKPKVERIKNPLEWSGQAELVNWARKKGLPLISIPNSGKRSLWQGQKEKAMGLTVGVSDLFLAMPNHKYHGYWIEMKAKGKKPTELQRDWLKKMLNYGYAADWFDDWEKAKDSIEFYLTNADNIA